MKIEVTIEASWACYQCSTYRETLEIDGNDEKDYRALKTKEERDAWLREYTQDWFFEQCNWGYEVVKEESDEGHNRA